MRRHLKNCEGYKSSEEEEDTDDGLQRGEQSKRFAITLCYMPHDIDESSIAEEIRSNPVNNRVQYYNCPGSSAPKEYEEHLRKALDATINGTTEDEEPVKVLRTFSCHFSRGRPLDIRDPTQVLEGVTAEIFVSRSNLFEDGVDELLCGTGHDPSITLEVTFSGENAQDVGGPRKEFLGTMVRQIKERLFVQREGESTYVLQDDIVALNRQYYFATGLIFGYSILQGEPLPCFMHEELLSKLFGLVPDEDLSSAEIQLREGLSKFGLVELVRKRRSLMYILRQTACAELTYPRMVKLLVPVFSEAGSNKHIKENRSYRLFLNYLKEVAAGRRESVSFGSILKFLSGAENEPILGFAVKPSLTFSDSLKSCLPTSNTCINQLTLAIGDLVPGSKDEMFEKFDLAFSNDYFGMV